MATGRMTGPTRAFTEMVAPMPRPSQTARMVVMSSRQRRSSAIVTVANARATQSAANGPDTHRMLAQAVVMPGGQHARRLGR